MPLKTKSPAVLVVSDAPGGALKPRHEAAPLRVVLPPAAHSSGGTRAPLQICALTGLAPPTRLVPLGCTSFIPEMSPVPVRIELVITSLLRAGPIRPAWTSSVRRPTSQ